VGSIYKNDLLKPYTPPKRYIPKNKKHEESLQLQVCKYLRLQYPHVIFRSDYASGLKLTKNQAVKHKRMQSSRSWPDLFIYEPSREYHGLAIELKKDGESVVLKIGPRKGCLSTDPHIQEQAAMLKALLHKGYYANFAVGYDEAVRVIDWYFNKKVPTNGELF
jgi:hypothetical protein